MSDGQLGEDTYSLIFMSLRHPIRRKILRMLADRPLSFSEILDAVSVDSGHLSYHLENLGELVRKPQDGKYALSNIGVAAVKLMGGVEEHQIRSIGKEPRTRLTAMNIYPLILVAALIAASFFFVNFTVPLRGESLDTSGTLIHIRPGETFAFNVTIVYTAGMEHAVLTNDSFYHEKPSPISTVTVWEEGAFWFDLTPNETYSILVSVFHPDISNVAGTECNVTSGVPIGGLVVFRLDGGYILRSEYYSLSGAPISGLGLTSVSEPGEYILEISNIGLQDLQGLLAFHEQWQFFERPWFFYGVACFLLALPYPLWIVFLFLRKPRV